MSDAGWWIVDNQALTNSRPYSQIRRMSNHLYYGDNLDILRNNFADESVDLIYLDPPFNSQANYNVLFRAPSGQQSKAQIEAFEDTWHWNEHAEAAFDGVMHSGNGDAAEMLRAMRSFLKENDMMAYLTMMAIRLIELHRVLRPSGAMYLHCDPTASHYLKVLMDGVFEPLNFRSEIIWRRSSSHNSTTRQFGPVHDTILCYARSDAHRLRLVTTPHVKGPTERKFRFVDEKGPYRLNEIMGPGRRTGDSGKPWHGYDPSPKNRHWAIPDLLRSHLPNGGGGISIQEALDALLKAGEIVISGAGRPEYKQRMTAGVGLQDIWAFQPGTEGCLVGSPAAIDEDVRWLGSDSERLGYPTQKPVGLLERILRASSNEGDVVLDPFCGCGTTIHAAQKLRRQWIGIDITHLAISLIEKRLNDAFPGIEYIVHGTPKDIDGARALFTQDAYQFQWWAISLINAVPYGGKKKGADSGIDGFVYFKPDGKTTEKAIVSVKGGENVNVAMIRDMGHVVDREKAKIGIFITLTEPTAPMKTEAVKAGFYETPHHGKVRKLQILTIADLFAGKKPQIPFIDATSFKAAPREATAKQEKLL